MVHCRKAFRTEMLHKKAKEKLVFKMPSKGMPLTCHKDRHHPF